MVTICGQNEEWEYPWEIDPTVPHEHGEPQTDIPVDEPCPCTPITISEDEFDRRRKAVFEELQIDH